MDDAGGVGLVQRVEDRRHDRSGPPRAQGAHRGQLVRQRRPLEVLPDKDQRPVLGGLDVVQGDPAGVAQAGHGAGDLPEAPLDAGHGAGEARHDLDRHAPA